MYNIEINANKQQELEEKIIQILPHGSGINYDWNITITKGAIVVKNRYDYMTEHGYYDGVFPFSVKFTPNDFTLHFHKIQGAGYKKIQDTGIREYLEDTFAEVHKDIKPLIIQGKKNNQQNTKRRLL